MLFTVWGGMRDLLEAGALVQDRFTALHWRFCFIGGVANLHWGTPRVTNDLDITLLTGFGNEDRFVEALLNEFSSRVAEPMEFARQNRVVLLRTADGIGIDVALGAMPFEAKSIERARLVEVVPGIRLRLCSAEDLVVHKAFAARPQDWADIEGILLRQRCQLQWDQIFADLGELAELKGEPELVGTLRGMIRRVESVLDSSSAT